MRKYLKRTYLDARGAVLKAFYPLLPAVNFFPGKEDIKSILLIRKDRIGDVVLSTPAMKAVREAFPAAKITVLLAPGTKGLLSGAGFIDEIITDDAGSVLSKGAYDLACDLHLDHTLGTAMNAFRSRARFRLGYDINGRGLFFNIRVVPDGKRKHFIDETADLLKAIGVRIKDRKPSIAVDPGREEAVGGFLEKNGVRSGDTLITLHPGGFYPTQRWPAARYRELFERIQKGSSAKVVVIEGPGEKALTEEMTVQPEQGLIVFRERPLNDTVALIRRADLFIGNNSGPLHIASALGTPTVSIMGPTVPERWSPVGDNNTVLRYDAECSPCNDGRCLRKDHLCMTMISVDEVYRAAREFLPKKFV
ncbi:MAG: glycosyltransferase family 9 protein [Candidatus Omnitrophica bacterium]|nr:glycosyltransferase family 9 protein [Candidatus Omnitrophota bacterium]